MEEKETQGVETIEDGPQTVLGEGGGVIEKPVGESPSSVRTLAQQPSWLDTRYRCVFYSSRHAHRWHVAALTPCLLSGLFLSIDRLLRRLISIPLDAPRPT